MLTTKSCDGLQMIRIVIADDHPITRASLRWALLERGGFEIVGEAGDGFEALALTLEQAPDMLLLDLHMPNLNGIGVLEMLKRWGLPSRALVLTGSDSSLELLQVIQLGAAGIVRKIESMNVIVEALHRIHAGGEWLPTPEDLPASPPRPAAATNRKAPAGGGLTPREAEVIRMVVQGRTNREIAASLQIREHTVSNHVCSIMQKMEAPDRFTLALVALHAGIAPIREVRAEGADSPELADDRAWELGFLMAKHLSAAGS